MFSASRHNSAHVVESLDWTEILLRDQPNGLALARFGRFGGREFEPNIKATFDVVAFERVLARQVFRGVECGPAFHRCLS